MIIINNCSEQVKEWVNPTHIKQKAQDTLKGLNPLGELKEIESARADWTKKRVRRQFLLKQIQRQVPTQVLAKYSKILEAKIQESEEELKVLDQLALFERIQKLAPLSNFIVSGSGSFLQAIATLGKVLTATEHHFNPAISEQSKQEMTKKCIRETALGLSSAAGADFLGRIYEKINFFA